MQKGRPSSQTVKIEAYERVQIPNLEDHFDVAEGNERPLAIWIVGRPAAGKTTAAVLLGDVFRKTGHRVEIVDGEKVRALFGSDLGHSKEDRLVALERVIYVNRFLQDRGIIPITATGGVISGFSDIWKAVRSKIENVRIVFLECTFDVAARRDNKGIYARALAGEIKDFYGVDMRYEVPTEHDLRINSGKRTPPEIVQVITDYLSEKGFR